jgi:hypothetical protein
MDGGVSTQKDQAFSQIPFNANWPIDGGFSNNNIIHSSHGGCKTYD